jgi:hypothetical protein
MLHKKFFKYIFFHFLENTLFSAIFMSMIWETSCLPSGIGVYTRQLGGLHDSQATNRSAAEEQEILAQSPPCLLLVAWETALTLSRMVTPVYIVAWIRVKLLSFFSVLF